MATLRREPPLEVALQRYKQGQCPTCSKGKGGPKGLQRRADDMYCHTCRRPWRLSYSSATALGEELPLVEVQDNEEEQELAPPRPWISRVIKRLVHW